VFLTKLLDILCCSVVFIVLQQWLIFLSIISVTIYHYFAALSNRSAGKQSFSANVAIPCMTEWKLYVFILPILFSIRWLCGSEIVRCQMATVGFILPGSCVSSFHYVVFGLLGSLILCLSHCNVLCRRKLLPLSASWDRPTDTMVWQDRR